MFAIDKNSCSYFQLIKEPPFIYLFLFIFQNYTKKKKPNESWPVLHGRHSIHTTYLQRDRMTTTLDLTCQVVKTIIN